MIRQRNPNHAIRVTGGGPFGRAWLDCSCGIARVFPSKLAADRAGLLHYADVTPQADRDPAYDELLQAVT